MTKRTKEYLLEKVSTKLAGLKGADSKLSGSSFFGGTKQAKVRLLQAAKRCITEGAANIDTIKYYRGLLSQRCFGSIKQDKDAARAYSSLLIDLVESEGNLESKAVELSGLPTLTPGGRSDDE